MKCQQQNAMQEDRWGRNKKEEKVVEKGRREGRGWREGKRNKPHPLKHGHVKHLIKRFNMLALQETTSSDAGHLVEDTTPPAASRVLLLDFMFIQPWSSTTNMDQSSEEGSTIHGSICKAKSTVLKAYSILSFATCAYTVTFISWLQLCSLVPSNTMCLPSMPWLLLPVCSQDSNVVVHMDSINKHWRIDVTHCPIHPHVLASVIHSQIIKGAVSSERRRRHKRNASTTWGTRALWGRKLAIFG